MSPAPALAPAVESLDALAAWVADVEVETRYGLTGPADVYARGHRDGLLDAAEQVRTILRRSGS